MNRRSFLKAFVSTPAAALPAGISANDAPEPDRKEVFANGQHLDAADLNRAFDEILRLARGGKQ